ncbi:MAG: hypothetical protein JW788_04175 [Candidatus Omnitrophica bacterium]|nr:hypothetical protein [Candidatus Omnitrophota bacterium]
MIVKMKKASVITQGKDAGVVLRSLRKLGLLHVVHANPPSGRDIALINDDISLVDSCLRVLQQEGFKAGRDESGLEPPLEDWKHLARHIIELKKRHEQLDVYCHSLTQSIAEWQKWGDFDPRDIEKLSEEGIYVRFYQLPIKNIAEFPPDVLVKKINVSGGIGWCIAICRRKIEVPFSEINPPRHSLSWMQKRILEDKKAQQAIEDEIRSNFRYYSVLIKIRKDLEKERQLQEALSGMQHYEKLVSVGGYIPFDKEELLIREAKSRQWAVVISEPGESDNVPVLIRNPWWVSLINPVFKLLGILPGYRELDISPLFLIFLSLFFGMIIGDAGYGAVYFLLTFIFHKTIGKRVSDTRIFFLFYLFSACAIFWGLITATVFGQEWYLNAGFKPVIPILNDTKFLQAFCFFLGAFHLSLAHGWQAIRKMPSLSALSDIGWISVLWAAFFIARTLILNDPFPVYGKWLISGGIFLVILFTRPQRNILKAILSGLGAVALNLMNNFTDIVSYIRLFAVGLATVAIADTINTLALGLGDTNVLGRIVVLFIGHTINIILGPMSVLVHGIRLNVLEFSGHAGLTWGAISYQPLAEQEA